MDVCQWISGAKLQTFIVIYHRRIADKVSSKKIAAGKKIQLKAVVAPSNATNPAVTWTSSNTKYATVTSKGKVTMKKAGIGKMVTITATETDGSGKKAIYKIKIMKHAVKKVKITARKRTVQAGKTLKLKATVTTTGKSANKTLKWTSSNTKYATVSKSGKVKGKQAGKGKKVTIAPIARYEMVEKTVSDDSVSSNTIE